MGSEREEKAIWDLAERIKYPGELTGSFRVKMWWWLKNKKVIEHGRGLNIAYGVIPWGKFSVLWADGKDITFEYDDGIIHDLIRRIKSGHYIGKFYRSGKFERYFRLERIGRLKEL